MKALIERNLKVFFRDKASVFFSLLAVLIIFLLYMAIYDAPVGTGDRVGEHIPFIFSAGSFLPAPSFLPAFFPYCLPPSGVKG